MRRGSSLRERLDKATLEKLYDGAGLSTAQIAEKVRFSRPQGLDGVEVVTAHYRSRSFPPHAHEEYVLGAMISGSEVLSIGGEDHLIDRDRIILIGPGEVHSNRGATDNPFGYAVMYLSAPLICEMVSEIAGQDLTFLPRFAKAAPSVPALRSAFLQTHSILRRDSGLLAQESAILLFLSKLFRARQFRLDDRSAVIDKQAVQRVREYLDSHFREGFSLSHLAGIAGVSRFHLIRSFKDHIGLTPSAYHLQLRILAAKRLISDGCPIAHAAAEVGFSDQSHLTRHFQRIVGTSPGRYAQQ